MKYLQSACILFLASSVGCSATEGRGNGGNGGNGGGNDAGVGGGGGDDGGSGLDDGGIFQQPDGMTVVMDPVTCAEAAANKSYIGCDYWPTVVANAVWSIFDFAAVVSNPGQNPAMVTITGPPAPMSTTPTNISVVVMPGTLEKIYLPWQTALKGQDANSSGSPADIPNSVRQVGGAYHLVSSVPVLVYQFNALEYAPKEGPAGKDWSKCPGTGTGTVPPCFSYSNDASLLLPSTAMTGNYRVLTTHGINSDPGIPGIIPGSPGQRSYIAITATQDSTTVKVLTSSTADIVASIPAGNIAATPSNSTATFMLNAGDVIELFSSAKTAADMSGTLVQADKAVQVIGGVPCIANPSAACDHVEESVMPAETLGQHYVVNVPTGPHDKPVATTVRMVGNVDGTTLQFSPSVSGAPASLNAGQVYEFDASTDFVVTGNHEFAVGMVMKSGSVVDPMPITSTVPSEGDPSLSSAIAVEQYRLKYVFLAPDDYDLNYADVVAPMGANLQLDGAAVTVTPSQVGTTGYGVFRIKLSSANGGTHTLTSDQPAGLQILGYGQYTSYQYPGGLDLLSIAPPPPPIS